MVKISQEIDIEGNYKYLLEVDLVDLIRAKPSRMAREMKRVYNATHKTSDLLMWLSEEVRAIEMTENNEDEATKIDN